MPSDIMDQRGASTLCLQPAPASLICEEIHFPIERQVVFWKHDHVPDHSGTKAVSLMSNKRSTGLPMTSWRVGGQDCHFRPDLYVQSAPGCVDADKFGLNGTYYENGLFSSPLSETFDQKLKQSANDVHLGQSVDIVNSNLGEDAPFESLEEIEAQTIGDLLPDDDDLLAGVVDVLEYGVQPNARDDMDDIFCSGGGMEVEEGDNFSCTKYFDARGEAASNGHQGALNCQFASEHPSRTLFVGNIESNVEEAELKALFEQFGDLRTLYTACKHQGFVIISYYDIRAARNAMRALQNKPLRHQKLDIHFSIPKDNLSEEDINQDTLVVCNLDSSVSNVDIHQIFGVYGGIKEVRESPHKHHQKFIKFYDVRAAEAALHALNRTYVAGKKIMLEPSRPGGARRCVMQHSSPELELESSGVWHGSPPNNSPARCYGPIPLGVISSSGLDSGSVQGPHPAVCTPARPDMETAFQRTCSGTSHRLSSSSPTMVAPVGNHSNPSGHGELSHSFGQMKLGIQHMPGSLSHPHSGYNDVIEQGFPYNSTTMSAMAINSGSGEGVDVRHIHSVGSSSLSNHSIEHGESAFRYSGNGCCPLHVNQQYMWNNAAIYDQHHPGSMMWPNQPVIVNSILPQMHGLPGAPCHIVNTVLPLPHHHVGPAPAMNASHWERREVYPGDMDVHAFYPNSPGSMGVSGNSPMDTLELDSHNIFPRDGGNCEESAHVRTTPPRQRCHFFHRRNLKVPSTDGPNNRARYRRSDSSANQADNKKQYELDVECIMRGEDSRTTLMIKNIPNKYTSKVLLAAIDEHSRGTYDFVYLPIDFRNNCNMGYAFINMIDPQQIIPFYQAFNGKKWEKFSSEKVAELAYARIQGKAALIAHFQNSSLMNEDKRCRPMLFHSGGPNAGDQEPFPVGVNIRSRPGRLRTACYEESRQESL